MDTRTSPTPGDGHGMGRYLRDPAEIYRVSRARAAQATDLLRNRSQRKSSKEEEERIERERKAVARPNLGPEQDHAGVQGQEELGDADAPPRAPEPPVECGGRDENPERCDAAGALGAPTDDACGTVRAHISP